jgi:DNA ligase-1
MKIIEILDLIGNTSSSNTKREILENNKSEFLDMIFNDTYDTNRSYYIKKLNKNLSTGELDLDNDYYVFHDALNVLCNREITGDAAIDFIEKTISRFNKESQTILFSILDRNLKIGISRDSFNKISNNKIEKFEVALAYNLDKVKGVNPIDGTYYASRKLDGVRCIAICKVNCGKVKSIELKSRQGKTFTTLDKLKPAIEKFMSYNFDGIWILDGEVCLVDENGDEHFDWIMKEINRKNYTIENPRYKLFDLIDGNDFFEGFGNVNFNDRYNKLYEAWTHYAFNEEQDLLQPIVQEIITCQEDFDRWSKYVSNNNWEGFMLRKNTGYKSGRTKDLIKVKKFQDAEYTVIGYELGDIKYGTETFKDVVTCLHIIHKGNRVNVGSGISKEQRILWKNKPEKIIGKTITVQYFEETTDSKTGTMSLRFPVLKYVYEKNRDC